MWKNNLKIAFRNLIKQLKYSVLNVVGLAIGMAVCILILVFVSYEGSFDSFHEKNIYRLNEVQNWEGMVAPQKVALTMYPMGPTLKEEFPEVLNFTRIANGGEIPLIQDDKEVKLSSTLWADETFLKLFDFNLLQGDATSALKEPNSLVLTEENAIKIFGSENALGKTLQVANLDSAYFTVTGVLADIPENSHLQFDAISSFATYFGPDAIDNWGSNWFTTYLELSDEIQVAELEGKFPEYLISHMGEEGAEGITLYLQSLDEVHSGSSEVTHDYFNSQKFDGANTKIFFYISLIVLFIAVINFVNLSTAKSVSRAKEIGVRKASGATRFQLYIQFISESILMTLISLLLALALVYASIPFLNEFSQRPLSLPLFSDPILLGLMLLGGVLLGILAGMYPAFYLSGFKPAMVIKGGTQDRGKVGFRSFLVVTQFACGIFLITATLFASRQLNYMMDMDLGFSTSQVVTIPFSRDHQDRFQTVKDNLLASSLISDVTGSGQKLGNNLHQTTVTFNGDGASRDLATSHLVVDSDFLDTYEIELIAGRDFSDAASWDNGRAFIINESLAKELLSAEDTDATFESLLGQEFGVFGMDSIGQIVGITKDFNFNSLHNQIETLALFNQSEWGYSEISIKINSDQAELALIDIESVWSQILPEAEFEYQFLDEHFASLYSADLTVQWIIGMLAALAILISCLGLFGLVSFTTEQRIKEIGIRKVLGASVLGIVMMISIDLIRLVVIALLIAIPITWFVMDNWIQDFAYRINLEWWVFALSGVMAIGIALLTVSAQATKAALLDPVRSLKSE
jgi:putative ABC transport system permease protein